jgi:4-amino-4-deoxy-L-arabinose transferase-like glycosyltransferase
MLVAVAQSADPRLLAYRDGILFQQTIDRYASAWHHVKPWYYFLVEVIPALWLPASLLLFWLVPRWKTALRERDARVWLPLAWLILTLVFFSASAGKRGIYLFPALPAFAIAAAPCLPELFRRRGVQYLSVALASLLVGGALVFVVLEAWGRAPAAAQLATIGVDPKSAVYTFAAFGLVVGLITWWRRPLLAWPAVLACLALVWSYGITPKIDVQRSGRGFVQRVLAQVPKTRELAFAGAKEQFFLYLDRPVVNFGHGRWLEKQREADDAARWLNAAPGRVLLAPQSLLTPCFNNSPKRLVGEASRATWSLVELPADPNCAARGDPGRVIRYLPTL